MKAAVLFECQQDLKLIEINNYPPLKRGQVLVKIFYSGICQSQLMEISGQRSNDPYLPHMLGHEGVGEVVSVGQDVTKVRPGNRVILGWVKGSGIDAGGSQFTVNKQIINAGAVTTFSEYSIVSENRLVLLPEGIPLHIAPLFGCAIPTGAGLVFNEIKPPAKSKVAVFGLGGIGFSSLLAMNSFDVSELIAIDVEDEKLEMAKKFGATKVINASRQDPVEQILKLTDGLGVDISIEAAGFCKTIEQAFAATKRWGGKCYFTSHPKHGDLLHLDPFELLCQKQIFGTSGGGSKPDTDIPFFAKLYLEKKLPLDELVSKPYTLDQINVAIEAVKTKKVFRAIIKISEPQKA